ncbi:hypothetical protein ABTY61_05735 [Kitasatospora sp. NPDC096128]|uniref:phosphoribosyltransferase-like protein n=1 Tax=Kitasatospora sp. NPDC096128 TaxID=3155547 RepID=UPI00332875EB
MQQLRPSATQQGEAWLSNFRPSDTAHAQLLIDSLHFVSSTSFRQRLSQHLHSLLADPSRVPGPAALYSVRSCELNETMFIDEKVPLVPATGGSELIVQNILRSTEQAFDTKVVSRQSWKLEHLRDRRVRSLVFVSDYAGSGDEAINYAKAWLRNPTIRSWRSLKLIRLHLVLFAASTTALRRLKSSAVYDSVHTLHAGMDFESAPWEPAQRKAIRLICERYAAANTGGRGWGGSEGLLVFEHTVPNNLPNIVRQTKGRAQSGKWVPFFKHRTAPLDLMNALTDYRPLPNRQQQLQAVRQHRLAAATNLHSMSRPELELLIDLLAHAAGRRRHPEQLAPALRVPIPTAVTLTELAQRLGLLDEERRLTDSGWQELRKAKAKPRHIAGGLQGNSDPYYPQALKGSR